MNKMLEQTEIRKKMNKSDFKKYHKLRQTGVRLPPLKISAGFSGELFIDYLLLF